MIVWLSAFSTLSHAEIDIENSYTVCSIQNKAMIEKKLSSFDKFQKIDQPKSEAGFLDVFDMESFDKANLIRSKPMDNDPELVHFVIQPGFIINRLKMQHPLSKDDRPQFYAKCSFIKSTDQLALECSQDHTKTKFAVDAFNMKIVSKTDATCPQNQRLFIGYEIRINEGDYMTIKNKFSRMKRGNMIVDRVIDYLLEEFEEPTDFFENYWSDFFPAWDQSNDWVRG
jgi:hypothetical protein